MHPQPLTLALAVPAKTTVDDNYADKNTKKI